MASKWRRKTITYHATAKLDGVQYYLGRFLTKEEAKAERDDFYLAYCKHPEDCRHPICIERRESSHLGSYSKETIQ